ncbi:MAG: hypothetical protein L0211_21890 [Planctomycetaceae bacterium]|nr:hypothetical protein [Planctomycetaceae bacterium]
MLRRFNYTNRKRIPRSAVTVRLRTGTAAIPTFDAKIDLSDLRLPGDARVYIEAYHRASYMRFPFGLVSDLRAPRDCRLTDIDGGATALFRVKVVDEKGEHGCVLAEADGISPLDSDQTAADRTSILPVVISDLGHEIWRVDFDTHDGRPVLELNKAVETIAQIALGDDQFMALVYPSAVRQILIQVLRKEERWDVNGPLGDWQTQWLRFACSLPGIMAPPRPNGEDDSLLEDQQLEWIETVVEAFCAHQKTLERFIRAHPTEATG